MELTYKKADLSDLDILTKTRIEVLRAANKLTNDVDMSLVEKETCKYYKSSFESNEHITYLVFEGDAFVGCGSVSFYKVMPTFHNPSGANAYIMNMYTKPKYRKKGIALKTLDLLVQESKKRDIQKISLEATDMGRPLYERYGFVPMKDEMEYLLVKNA